MIELILTALIIGLIVFIPCVLVLMMYVGRKEKRGRMSGFAVSKKTRKHHGK